MSLNYDNFRFYRALVRCYRKFFLIFLGWIKLANFSFGNTIYIIIIIMTNDKNICTNYGHQIKAVQYYIFTITDTTLRTRKSTL